MRVSAAEVRLQFVGIGYAVIAITAALVLGQFFAGRVVYGAGPANQPIHLIGLCLAVFLLWVAFRIARQSLLVLRGMRAPANQPRSVLDA